jgi:membrane protein implicated in regulation of membrane protease activity
MSLHYGWWIVALLLIGAEVLAPGYFMLWIGIAAAGTGLVVLAVPDMGLLAQAVCFGVLTFASCFAYARWLRPRMAASSADAPLLNRRGQQMVGQRYVLCEAIVHGRGKARVGDGTWLVTGPELPAGATVEVVGVDGTTLAVKAVDVG